MKDSNSHNDNKPLAKHHKDKLGLEVPDGYFAASKRDILAAVSETAEPKRLVFGLRPIFAYPIAATIALLIGITIWQYDSGSEKENQLTEIETNETINPGTYEGDALISSLLVDDADMEQFTDTYIMNEVVLAAERSEQEMENFIINSLFVEDSLIDSYMDKKLLEEIIL